MQSKLVNEARSWQQWGKQGAENKKQVLEKEAVWKEWEAEKAFKRVIYIIIWDFLQKFFPSINALFQ